MASLNMKELQINATQLSHVLGLSAARVSVMEKKGIIRRAADGKFSLCEAVRAYVDTKKQKKGDAAETVYDSARAKKMQATAEIEEMNLQLRKGSLVDIESVVDIVKTEYAIVRQRLFTIPNKVALDIFACENPEEVQEILLTQFNEALDELKYDTGREIDGSAGERTQTGTEANPS